MDPHESCSADFSGIPTAFVFVWVMTRIYLEDTG